MKKLRWGRISFAVIVLIILIVAAIQFLRSWTGSDTYQGALPDGPALNLPDAPLTPATMSDAQKKAAIEQARQDAIAAALASGQTEESASVAGDVAAQAANRAFYRGQMSSGKDQ